MPLSPRGLTLTSITLYGPKVSLITVGPAGEMSVCSACIACTDMEGRPSRMSGRGGLGAVMGAKGLKAIVLAYTRSRVTPADEGLFRSAIKEYHQVLLAAPTTETYATYGTAAMLDKLNAMGRLPTRNFSRGKFEKAEEINGARLREVILERGGEGNPTHGCMPGCVIRCSNIYPDAGGKTIVAPLEYETIGLLGSNCGIGDLV